MTTSLAKIEPQSVTLSGDWREKVDLIKRTVAVGATDEELQLFLHQCAKTGLDPLSKQIYCVKRWNSKENRETMTIQLAIDGYRVIADRTGKYAPGRAPIFEERDNQLYSATAFVMKLVGNKWHEVSATAFWSEYVQQFWNRKEGKFEISPFWKKMGHTMLAKCAEALALRKAFPADLSGMYTHDEMQQADSSEEPQILNSKCTVCGEPVLPYKTRCKEHEVKQDGAAEAPKAAESAAASASGGGEQPDGNATAPTLSQIRGKVLNEKVNKGKICWELEGKVLLWHDAPADSDPPAVKGLIVTARGNHEGVKKGFDTYELVELVNVEEAPEAKLGIQEQDMVPVLQASLEKVAKEKTQNIVPDEGEEIPF